MYRKMIWMSIFLVFLMGWSCIEGWAVSDDDALSLIGVLDVHRERDLRGKGIKIAVIDSGVDPTHSAFKGKKILGYDFVEKRKKLSDGYGHGTHVIGIILQVAPKAVIYSYRILDNNGHGVSEAVCRAFRAAIKARVDVINFSIRNTKGGDLLAEEIRRAVGMGIVVVVSAGNEGDASDAMVFPATSSDVITVGSSTKKIRVPVIRTKGAGEQMQLIPVKDAPKMFRKGKFRIVDVGLGENQADYKGVKGRVVLVQERGRSLFEIAEMAHQEGAVAVIGYNQEEGEWDGESKTCIWGDRYSIPTAALAREYGVRLRQQIALGFSEIRFDSIRKECMDPYSSHGFVGKTGKTKPDVVAPGVKIVSCVPSKLKSSGYRKMTGTSMATPYVTGIVALLKELHPEWTPEKIKEILKETADPLQNTLHHEYGLNIQGAGRVNVHRVMDMEYHVGSKWRPRLNIPYFS